MIDQVRLMAVKLGRKMFISCGPMQQLRHERSNFVVSYCQHYTQLDIVSPLWFSTVHKVRSEIEDLHNATHTHV